MFFGIIEELARAGTTVMVSTHFMDEAERCHRIAFLSAGALLAVDTPEKLKKQVIKGHLVELALQDGMERINSIERLPYVKECNIHGSLLHVLLESERYEEELEDFTGSKPKGITPSLEDVFVTLSKHRKVGEKSA
jgi:ABC-2 type transport system ATP-binding protein